MGDGVKKYKPRILNVEAIQRCGDEKNNNDGDIKRFINNDGLKIVGDFDFGDYLVKKYTGEIVVVDKYYF